MITKLNSAEVNWFLKAISYSPTVGFKAIGQLDVEGLLIAAVGYDHWTPNSVQMHIWIPHTDKISKTFIQEGFRYPFEICGRGLVVGLTPGNNAAALHFNKRVGFKEVYRMKDAWDVGVDVVVQEMRREECRWLRRKHELVQQETEKGNEGSRPGRGQAAEIHRRVLRRSDELVSE